ncbi:MAG: Dabb family protein [Prevotella sp.]|nr:Dabb family protein [Prevotella sp.]MCM1474693.1 Dabb family protein [Muribaculaceae bacterium]
MVKHIVMFKLKGSAEERLEVSRRFCEALNALPEQIECLRSMETGINTNQAEDWDVVLTAVVDKMKDVAVYANHPAHVAAAAIVAPLKDSRACVDYEIL